MCIRDSGNRAAMAACAAANACATAAVALHISAASCVNRTFFNRDVAGVLAVAAANPGCILPAIRRQAAVAFDCDACLLYTSRCV